MGDPVRTFIAIELDEATRRAIGDAQAQLKHARGAHDIRWVAPENIHLTLKFLGDVDAEKMPALTRALADACASIAPFTLTFGGVGAFPNTRRPNVIWVGVAGEAETATRLSQKIDDACAGLGFAREARPLSPHLTVGRVKRDARKGRSIERPYLGEMIANAKIGALGKFRVEHVSVMKSELKPGGSVYTRLAVVQLTKDE